MGAKAQKEEFIMLNVEETIKQMQEEGTIVEEVTPMESLSLRIMSLLSQHQALFKMVTANDPSEAYDKAGQALRLFISFETVKDYHTEAKILLSEYRTIEEVAGKGSVDQLDMHKALMSSCLWEAGHFLAKTGAFGMDTASILSLFAARMAVHTAREAKWAGIEIKKSFIRRFF